MICMSEPREVRFSCGHAVCCRGCAESLLAMRHPCPTCRTEDITQADVGMLGSQPTYVQQRRHTRGVGSTTTAGETAPIQASRTRLNAPPQLPGVMSLGQPMPSLQSSLFAQFSQPFGFTPPTLQPNWQPPRPPPQRPPPPPMQQAPQQPLPTASPTAPPPQPPAPPQPERLASPPALQPLPSNWIDGGGEDALELDGELEGLAPAQATSLPAAAPPPAAPPPPVAATPAPTRHERHERITPSGADRTPPPSVVQSPATATDAPAPSSADKRGGRRRRRGGVGGAGGGGRGGSST